MIEPVEQISDPNTNLFVEPTATKGYARSMRSQADNLGDAMSDLSMIWFDQDETQTKQEFKEEADINYLLTRFGANAQQKPVEWGQEVDYSLDLQTALDAMTAAQATTKQVPPELISKYPTWRHVLAGVESGQYEYDLKELATRKEAHKTRQDAMEKAYADSLKQTPEAPPKDPKTD